LVLYIIGWFQNRNITLGYKVPQFIAFLCGKKEPILSAGGLFSQWLALTYFVGALPPILLLKNEHEVGFWGITGWIIGGIILGFIWIISIRKVS
jgi:hypothetical protein